jgi:hypothetical protein
MPADQIRNRTVGCKMTDDEYERLSAVVESEGMTLGEWCREVLLERAEGRKPSVIEETLLAEVLALRTILLNLHFTVAKGEASPPLSSSKCRSCIASFKMQPGRKSRASAAGSRSLFS